jgi:hypothetical protein
MATNIPAGAEVTLTIRLTVGPWTPCDEGYERRWSGPVAKDGSQPAAARVTKKAMPWPFKPRWEWSAGDPYSDEWIEEGALKQIVADIEGEPPTAPV